MGVERRSLALLAASVFTVALGYGVILPILPTLIERIGGHASAEAVSWHAGALSGAYMFAVFVGAPLWGYISDRKGRRAVITAGLAGYAVTLAVFAFARTVWVAYLARVLAGAFVSAVLPVASAYVGGDPDARRRARSFALLGAATLFGFLVGPAFSGWIYAFARGMGGPEAMVTEMAGWPLYAAASLGVLVFGAVYFGLSEAEPSRATAAPRAAGGGRPAVPVRRALLVINFLAMFGLGALEVALPLLGGASLDLDPTQIAVLFAECSLVMIAVQGLVFFTPLFERVRGEILLALGFAAMAVGFALLGQAAGYPSVLVAVAFVASGSGLLLPAVGFIASVRAAASLGALLGALTAAGSLGQAVGSAAGGWLYGAFPGGVFWAAGGLMVVGAIASARGGLGKAPAARVPGRDRTPGAP